MDEALVAHADGLIVAGVDAGLIQVGAGHGTVGVVHGRGVRGETHHGHEPDDGKHHATSSSPRHSRR